MYDNVHARSGVGMGIGWTGQMHTFAHTIFDLILTIMLHPFPARARRLCLMLACLLTATACGGDDDAAGEGPDSASVSSAAPAAAGDDSVVTDSASALDALRTDDQVDSIVAAIRACPRDGMWHPCSIEQRFSLAGLRVVPIDSALGIPGVGESVSAWQIGSQQLRVAFFSSESAAIAALARFDSARAAPRGDTAVRWPARPTLLRNANVLAVLIGGTDRAIERASNALLAGPPQP